MKEEFRRYFDYYEIRPVGQEQEGYHGADPTTAGNGVRMMVLELPTTLMDMSKMDNTMACLMLETINNMMLELYASMAQAEIEKKEKRQREGIEMKKLRGEWDDYGRPAIIREDEFDVAFSKVIAGEITPTELRKELGLFHMTFYRYRKKYLEKHPEILRSPD